MRFRLSLPSPAMAVAFIALFVALGGSGYAAGRLVGAGAVRHHRAKPRPGGLTAAQVRSVVASYLAAHPPRNGVNGLPGATGPAGATGPQGLQGPATGPAGGDLAGNYPNPTLAPLEAPTGVSAAGASDVCPFGGTSTFCGSTGGPRWGSFEDPVAFWKDREGVVHLRGIAGYSAPDGDGQDIFFLPAGYRPPAPRILTATSASSLSSPLINLCPVLLSVGTNGEVYALKGTSGCSAAIKLVLFSSLEFRTDA